MSFVVVVVVDDDDDDESLFELLEIVFGLSLSSE